jgi:hypothetical protein
MFSPPFVPWAGRRSPARYDGRYRVGDLPPGPAGRVGVGALRLLFYDGMHEKVTIRSQISEKLLPGKPSGGMGWPIFFAASIVI